MDAGWWPVSFGKLITLLVLTNVPAEQQGRERQQQQPRHGYEY